MHRWRTAAVGVVGGMMALGAASPAAAQAGACCTFDQQCVPVADAAACVALGGVFLPGEDCANDPCGPGACCFNENCNQADAYSCISAGREFAGAGTSCLDDPCESGVGACCFADGSCLDLSPDDCAAQAGTWLGAGTNCGQGVCDLGACCTTNDCTNVAQYQCNAPEAVFLAGQDCAINPCNDCPPNTLFAQQRDDPDDFIAGTSEVSANFQRWEDFSGVAGSIEALTWWGLDLDHVGGNDFVECDEIDPTFLINFHEDAGGVPGALVCSYELVATRTPTGILYMGAELNEYNVALGQPCVLLDGWVSIVGVGDPECWFLWMSAGFGGTSWCDNCVPSAQSFDLSLCLVGTEGGVFGACCDDSAGTCSDNTEITDCVGGGLRFDPDGLCEDLEPPCGVVVGACCIEGGMCRVEIQADCSALGGNWLGANTLCSSCPCTVACPPGGIPEGEPVCGPDYVDEFNGGCAAVMALFSPIALGDTICGESGVFEVPGDVQPDFDWYEIIIDDPMQLQWSAEAEFPARIWIYEGGSGCANPPLLATTDGGQCEAMSVTVSVEPGSYWLVIRPTQFVDGAQCGSRYNATVENPCPEDLDGDGTVGIVDFLDLLSSWGQVGVPADFDGGGVGITDFLALLAAWGRC